MRPSHTRKKIRGVMYTCFAREDGFYADRIVKLLKQEGYRAVKLHDPKIKGQYEVWRSVNKIGQKGKGRPYFKGA